MRSHGPAHSFRVAWGLLWRLALRSGAAEGTLSAAVPVFISTGLYTLAV